MQKIVFLLTLICALPLLSLAQNDVPAVEVFGGYSYLRTGSGYDQDSHGWNTSLAVNVADHLALKGDFAGHYSSQSRAGIKLDSKIHTFMFGPQFNIRATERVNPFLHALFGVANIRDTITIGATRNTISDTGFAMAVGGGVDAKLNDHVSWRVFQADYLLTRYKDTLALPVTRRNVHNLRVSTGLVFH